MEEIARLLIKESDLSPLTLSLADEVIQRLGDLIGGFEDEIERRQEAGQPKPGEGGGQMKPKLVPPIAEIKLIRRRQQDLGQKIENFWRRNRSIREGEVSDVQRRVLERLLLQQGRLARMLEALKKETFGD